MSPPMGQAKKESLKGKGDKPSDQFLYDDVDLVLPSQIIEGELCEGVLHEVEQHIDIRFGKSEESVLVCPVEGWELWEFRGLRQKRCDEFPRLCVSFVCPICLTTC